MNKAYLMIKIDSLQSKLKHMKEYLLLKNEEEDWHGVADAAMDIREIVAQVECLYSLLKKDNLHD